MPDTSLLLNQQLENIEATTVAQNNQSKHKI